MQRTLAIIVWLVCSSCFAASTVNALSPSWSHVSNALYQVDAGGTVNIPAGSAAWTNPLTLTKPVSIFGAGTSQTFITNAITMQSPWSSGTYYPPLFYVRYTNDNPFRISRIFADCGWTNGGAVVQIQRTNDARLSTFRVDNLFINNCVGKAIAIAQRACYGLVDHCTFRDCKIGVNLQMDDINEWNLWTAPFYAIGTTNNVVVEDCLFRTETTMFGEHPFAVGGGDGMHYIFRHNVVTNAVVGTTPTIIDAHGNQSYLPNGQRGTIHIEVYNNTFYQPSDGIRTAHFRGGTCLVYSNAVFGSASDTEWNLDEEEAWATAYFSPLATVWPAQDQITNTFIWANTLNGSGNVTTTVVAASIPFIQEGRDYWLHSPYQTHYTNGNGVIDLFTNYTPLVYPHPLAPASVPAPTTLRFQGKGKTKGNTTLH